MNDRLREQLTTLQQRMDALCSQHEGALNDMAQSERQNLLRLEQEFLKREQEMQNEFEVNMRERDRKMGKTMTHASTLEQQYEQASRELERLREENVRLQLAAGQAKSERDSEESQFKRLRLQFEAQESHRQGLERDLKRFEEEQRRQEAEALRWRQEAARWKREAERFHQFTASLQGELKELDDELATTAECCVGKFCGSETDQWTSSGCLLRTDSCILDNFLSFNLVLSFFLFFSLELHFTLCSHFHSLHCTMVHQNEN